MFSKLLMGVVYLALAMILVPLIELIVIKFFLPEVRGWEWLERISYIVIFSDTIVFIVGVLLIGYWMGRQ